MAKLTTDQKKQLAYDLYMNTDKLQSEIAELVGVTAKTLTSWKQKGNWEELREAETVTTGKIVRNLYRRAYELSEEDMDSKNVDQIAKLAKSIEQLSDRKVTVANIINVFQEFTTWAFKREPELAKQINALQQDYVNEKING